MKNLFSTFPAILLGTLLLVPACDDASHAQDTSSGEETTREQEDVAETKTQQKCTGTVLVEMGDVTLRISRDPEKSWNLHRKDGESLYEFDEPNKDYTCEQDVIENVTALRRPHTSIYYKPERSTDSSYKSTHQYYDKNRIRINPVVHDNGVKEIRPDELLKVSYVLPQDKFPTANNEPVLYSCDTQKKDTSSYPENCRSKYYHPMGLFISYKFKYSGSVSISRILEEERKKRELIKNMIVNETGE